MTTDPRALPGADPHTGNREIDPVTGYETTGHDWNGIRELNTPFPRIALIALALAFAYAVVAWILLPAWPTGRDYTRGLLGLDQGEVAEERLQAIAADRAEWLRRFEAADFEAIASDPALMELAMPAAQRLFGDNCAACHGRNGEGGPGFPVLADATWLWSGAPEEIATTIRHGINADDPDTRIAEMPSFDWMDRADRLSLADFVASLPEGKADWNSPAAALFAENCAACHGERGEGGLAVGAPSLTDRATIYGQDAQTVFMTLTHGRRGVMPAWAGRLSDAEINLLALYVSRLSDATREEPQ